MPGFFFVHLTRTSSDYWSARQQASIPAAITVVAHYRVAPLAHARYQLTLSALRRGLAPLEHVLPAIDGDIGAGDEGGLFRRKIGDEPRNFVGLPQPAHRDLRNNL